MTSFRGNGWINTKCGPKICKRKNVFLYGKKFWGIQYYQKVLIPVAIGYRRKFQPGTLQIQYGGNNSTKYGVTSRATLTKASGHAELMDIIKKLLPAVVWTLQIQCPNKAILPNMERLYLGRAAGPYQEVAATVGNVHPLPLLETIERRHDAILRSLLPGTWEKTLPKSLSRSSDSSCCLPPRKHFKSNAHIRQYYQIWSDAN